MVNGSRTHVAAGELVAGVPHDDLALEVVKQLDESGIYRVTVDAGCAQGVVDLRWAALRISRLRGREVRVVVGRMADLLEAPVTVRLTYAPERRTAIPQQRDPSTAPQ